MSRLSIEIPESQHQQIKAMAALRGISIKEYILERTLPSEKSEDGNSEAAALAQLEALLVSRIKEVDRGKFSNTTMKQIMAEARVQRKAKK